MKYTFILALMTALPAAANDLPEGLESARFLPGWINNEGNRIAALELILEPGWKTYWRSPGDAGLPPQFKWEGNNIGTVQFHWPAPEVFESAGLRTLGYHDRLVLPFTVIPQNQDKPVKIAAHVLLGVCSNVCIPVDLNLTVPSPDNTPDPVIEAALATVPRSGSTKPACEISKNQDGAKVTFSAPEQGTEIAIENSSDAQIWVSTPQLSADGRRVSADFVASDGKPFLPDPSAVVLTVLGPESATEYHGCDVS